MPMTRPRSVEELDDARIGALFGKAAAGAAVTIDELAWLYDVAARDAPGKNAANDQGFVARLVRADTEGLVQIGDMPDGEGLYDLTVDTTIRITADEREHLIAMRGPWST